MFVSAAIAPYEPPEALLPQTATAKIRPPMSRAEFAATMYRYQQPPPPRLPRKREDVRPLTEKPQIATAYASATTHTPMAGGTRRFVGSKHPKMTSASMKSTTNSFRNTVPIG
jgi:hypothetical protein